MTKTDPKPDIDCAVTIEQIARLERALLDFRKTAIGLPEALDLMAASQYSFILELRAELDAALGLGSPAADRDGVQIRN